MSDDELRCRHCKQPVALTQGPDYKKPRGQPTNPYRRGYAVEFGHATTYVCQACLQASTRVALRKVAG